MDTLPETNISTENKPSQKVSNLPTIHFQGRLLLVSGSRVFAGILMATPPARPRFFGRSISNRSITSRKGGGKNLQHFFGGFSTWKYTLKLQVHGEFKRNMVNEDDIMFFFLMKQILYIMTFYWIRWVLGRKKQVELVKKRGAWWFYRDFFNFLCVLFCPEMFLWWLKVGRFFSSRFLERGEADFELVRFRYSTTIGGGHM